MFSTNHPCAAYLWLTIPQAFSLRYFKISCENSTTENPPRINGSMHFVLGNSPKFKHVLDFRLQLVLQTSLDVYAYAFKNSFQDLNLEKCPPSPFRLSFAWQIWKLVVTRSWMALLLHRFQTSSATHLRPWIFSFLVTFGRKGTEVSSCPTFWGAFFCLNQWSVFVWCEGALIIPKHE